MTHILATLRASPSHVPLDLRARGLARDAANARESRARVFVASRVVADLTTRKRSTRKESSNIDRAKMYIAKRTLHYVSDESEDDDSCDDEVGTLSHKMKSPTRNKHRNSKHASYTHRPRQMDDSVRV